MMNRASSRVEVSTTEYQFAHGRMPRGRGLWFFTMRLRPGRGESQFIAEGTYAEARKAALVEACRVGATMIKVGS